VKLFFQNPLDKAPTRVLLFLLKVAHRETEDAMPRNLTAVAVIALIAIVAVAVAKRLPVVGPLVS